MTKSRTKCGVGCHIESIKRRTYCSLIPITAQSDKKRRVEALDIIALPLLARKTETVIRFWPVAVGHFAANSRNRVP
jgi:hypothetical protein